MFGLFGKKNKPASENNGIRNTGGSLENEYNKLLEKHNADVRNLENKALVLTEKDDYSDPMIWMDALAICDVALSHNALTEVIKKLYWQIYSFAWNKHVSVDLDDTDYDFWFKLNEKINDRFIAAGHNRGYAEQADLYGSARRPYRNYDKMREYYLKGVEVEDPASMGDYGYGLYFGIPGYGEADKEEGMRLIKRSKELDYEVADLLLIYVDFYDSTDKDELLKKLLKYIETAPEKRKAYYLLADYYLRYDQLEDAISAMREGVARNEHYSEYLYGMYILRGQVPDEDKNKAIGLLEKAFSYNTVYAANFLGQYYYYANDENSSVDKSIEWHEKAVSYYSHDSAFELAIIYLYNEEHKDVEKGMKYLELAIEEGNHRAMSEKAYLLIDNPNPEERKVDEAKELFEKAMDLGNDYAPYRLGLAYERGEFGGEPDYAKALELFELSAKRGNTYGLDAAGHYCRMNFVSEEEGNAAKAVDYFTRAIERNSNYSRVELALCYEAGYGVEKDYKKAFELYSQAAEGGYSYANLKMGYYYEDGLLGEEDLAKAFENFKIASEAGIPEATYNVGRYYKYAVGIPENPELALENFRQAAEQGDGQAEIEMALIYEYGYAGEEFDAQNAMEYMTRAAEKGYPYAQYKVGYYNYYGLLERDMEKGLEWFNKAYDQGYPYAALMLGDYYLYNHGGEEDYAKSYDYYKYAYEKDCLSEGLGICYEFGFGVEESATEALKYYTLAAEKGNTASKYRMGLCYKYGVGTAENETEAFNWFSKAVEDEHFSAQYEMAMMLGAEALKPLSS
ncbi:MAG: hypothetical protein ACLVKO_00780 [Dysgonomonas sp.]